MKYIMKAGINISVIGFSLIILPFLVSSADTFLVFFGIFYLIFILPSVLYLLNKTIINNIINSMKKEIE